METLLILTLLNLPRLFTDIEEDYISYDRKYTTTELALILVYNKEKLRIIKSGLFKMAEKRKKN